MFRSPFVIALLLIAAHLKLATAQQPQQPQRPQAKLDWKIEPGTATLRFAKYPGAAEERLAILEKTKVAGVAGAGPIFERELVRQGLLIALRDELGYFTRDGILGEGSSFNDQNSRAVLDLKTSFQPGTIREIELRRAGDAGAPLKKIPLEAGNVISFPALVEAIEAASRTQSVQLLKQLGATPADFQPKWNETAKLDRKTDRLLNTFSLPHHFEAIRTLHEVSRTEGESPVTLGTLAIAYADLARLSEFQWNAAHKAFHARSLLYAQRLVVKDKSSAWSLLCRAYAFALAGFHEKALSDLSAAETAPKPQGFEVPPWRDVIDAACRFDLARLDELAANRSVTRLARILQFTQIEDPYFLGYAGPLASKTLNANPECFRVIEGLSEIGGVSEGHTTTTLGPKMFYEWSCKRLKAIKDLPDAVTVTLPKKTPDGAKVGPFGAGGFFPVEDDNPSETWNPVSTFDALRAAENADASPKEFSWSVLYQLLNETQFVQIWRRAHFLKYKYGHAPSTTEFVQEALPYLENHPYKPLVEAYAAQGAEQIAAMMKFDAALDAAHVEFFHELKARRFLQEVDRSFMLKWMSVAIGNRDIAWQDIATMLQEREFGVNVSVALTLLKLSPHCSAARAIAITRIPQHVQADIPRWEKEAAGNPVMQRAFGDYYFKQNKLDDAIRCYNELITLSPDYSAYQRVASLYKQQGKMEEWKETIDRYIATGEGGLSISQAQVEVANYLIGLGKLEEAQEYAESAAQSGAEWAMRCALDVALRRSNFESACAYYVQLAERYPKNEYFLSYLRAAVRVSPEKFQRASQMARPTVFELSSGPAFEKYFLVGASLLLLEEHAKALEAYEKAFAFDSEEHSKMYDAFFAALLNDQRKRVAERDKMLEFVLATKDPNDAEVREAAKLIQASWKGEPFDHAALERLLADATPQAKTNAWYFCAFHMANHGEKEAARRYFELAATTPGSGAYVTGLLAAREMQKLGVMTPVPPPAPDAQ